MIDRWEAGLISSKLLLWLSVESTDDDLLLYDETKPFYQYV
jgi:hypothetical protein